MDASDIKVTSCEPVDNRRLSESGSRGVKLDTGHMVAGDQATCAKWATGRCHRKVSLRQRQRIGTWNIQGLVQHPGKLLIVEREMIANNIAILGMAETHWRGSGHFCNASGNTIYFSGTEDESRNGVAVIIPPKYQSTVIGYKPINSRLILVKLSTQPVATNILQVYAPTANSDEEQMEEFYKELSTAISDIPSREILIILGDFNAKIGKTSDRHHIKAVIGPYGLGERNERGDRLLEFCIEQDLSIMNTHFKQHPRRLYTWKSPGNRYRNQIDFILTRIRWKSSVINAKTLPGADCGSDHQLLCAELKLRLKTTRELEPRPPKPNRLLLKDFSNKIHTILRNKNPNSNSSAEASWQELRENIEEGISRCSTLPHKKCKPWMTDNTWQLIDERKMLKQTGSNSIKYSQLTRNIQKSCRKDKNQYISNICEEIDRHGQRNESRDLFQKVKILAREFKPKSWCIEGEDGKALHDFDQVLCRWKSYCEKLFCDDNDQEIFEGLQWESVNLEPSLLKSEVEQAIKFLKYDKSPGCDNIMAEFLQQTGEKGVEWFHDICEKIWKTGKWPAEWTTSVIIPLHKKGSTTKCENYRTITLLSHASKIMLHIIKQRLGPYVTTQIPEEQAGFVKGKGTREQILNMRQLIEKGREYQTPFILCFLDYKKAFDCVKWNKMWKVLVDMGVPQHLVLLIKNLYESSVAVIKIENKQSPPFKVSKGVRQGCKLSPDLFNLYGEYIMRTVLDGWNGGVSIAGTKISNLRFADDTTLIAANEDEMVELIQRIEDVSSEFGLEINRTKTKIMIIDRSNTLQITDKLKNFEIVDEFLYLGSVISNNGNCSKEIHKRIGMAKAAMTKLTKVWKDRSVSITTKVRLVRSLVFSIFLYGAETWTIREAERKKIDSFEMWCWRRMLRIPWTAHRTNVSVLAEVKVDVRLSSICLQRILQFFGHIARKGADSLERLIVAGDVPGKRMRGRSPTRWSDQVQKSTNSTFYTAFRAAEDRCRWRDIVHE